ncbi:MAG: Xaa-Pro peptidase family protein [Actinobacteria bacterium]|nr:Xaa-Pro peptidase family protein [Actinomycetota bacterium]
MFDSIQLESAYSRRLDKVQTEMENQGVDALVLSFGADLPWLTGYTAMPLERLTALVVPKDATPTLVIPILEAPRVKVIDSIFKIKPWKEFEDPHDLVAELISSCNTVGISDRTWAISLIKLQTRSKARFVPASKVTRMLRSVKDGLEIEMLIEAALRTDKVAQALLSGEIKMIGRTELEVSHEISDRLLKEGLSRVNFSIVGSGTNSASPHHEPGARIIGPHEAVVCDFGGQFQFEGSAGYCSDTTRTVVTGEMPERFNELYSILKTAQQRQLSSVKEGLSCQALDQIGRSHIEECGYGDYFIHRTGHGIGIEEHEDPYIVAGNLEQIQSGQAFSVEPGIYISNLYGARIEDIVLATEQGVEILNHSDRSLHFVG